MPVVMSMQSLEKEINGDGKRGTRGNKWWEKKYSPQRGVKGVDKRRRAAG